MKKMLSSLLALGLVFSFAIQQTEAKSVQENVNVLIGYKDTDIEGKVKNKGGKVKITYKKMNLAVASIPAGSMDELKKDKSVAFIEEDIKIHTSAQTQDWGINKVSAPIAWSNGFTGAGIKIGIIDTGIAAHGDLAISTGVSVVGYTASSIDDNGHGTHVAGIISAEDNDFGTVGIAPDSEIYPIKALDSNGSGYLSDIIAGINWAIDNQMDIINMSLGTNTDSQALHTAVDTAYNNGNGILVVAAAGNDASRRATDNTVDYPAKYSSVIAVGATDSDDLRAYFSSTGSEVEVAAPGMSIFSTYPGGYATLSGTSMAAPYVSGFLALLKQENPTLSNDQIRDLLHQKVRDIGAAGKDPYFGYGLIQANTIGVPVTDIPSAPATFTISSKTSSSVSLSWAPSLNATSYLLKRNGVVVYEGPYLTYVDSQLQANTTYQYDVYAQNLLGISQATSLSVTTDSTTTTKKGRK